MIARAAVVALSHALLLGFAVPVHAQHDAKPNARARVLFEAGREAYVAGRYREAAEAFERVFALTAHPFMLRNLGNAYEKLGEREKAIAALHQYLRLLPNAEDRTEIEARARLLEQEPEPPPAATVALTPAVTAAASPSQNQNQNQNQSQSQNQSRNQDQVRNQDATDDEDAVPAPPPAPVIARVHVDTSDSGLFAGRTFTWVALGASVALATTAGFLWLGAHSEYDKLAMSCGSHGGCSDAQLAGVTHDVTAANVSLALSGVAFAGALALFFIEGDAGADANRHARLVPSVSPHGAELTWRGRL